jgi:hypothetical protein
MQPAGYPPTPAIDTQKLRPSGVWFWVAGGIIILAIVGSVTVFGRTIIDLSDKVEDFERVAMPGSGTVQIDGTGGFTLYHEFPGASSDFASSSLLVTLAGPDGEPVDLDRYSGDVTYDYGGNEGLALYSFQVDEPGQYQVVGEGDTGEVAIGRGIGKGLVGGIVFGLVLGFGGVALGVVIIIVVAVRRSRDRRNRQVMGGQWGNPGPPGTGWGAASYPGAAAPGYPSAQQQPSYPGSQPSYPGTAGQPNYSGAAPPDYGGAPPPSYGGAPAPTPASPPPSYPGAEPPAGPTVPLPPPPPPPP